MLDPGLIEAPGARLKSQTFIKRKRMALCVQVYVRQAFSQGGLDQKHQQ